MAIGADRMNRLLEQLGSNQRVAPGQTIDEGFLALMEAIPGYIDRKLTDRPPSVHPDLDYVRKFGIGGEGNG